jgi:integrase
MSISGQSKSYLESLVPSLNRDFRDFGHILLSCKSSHLFFQKIGKYPALPELLVWNFQSKKYFLGKNTQGKVTMSISLIFCYNYFCEYSGMAKNLKRFANLNSDLKNYLRAEGKSEQKIKETFHGWLDSISLSALKDAEENLDKYLKEQVEAGRFKPRSTDNIRSSLKVFLKFIRQQEYYRQVNDRWHGRKSSSKSTYKRKNLAITRSWQRYLISAHLLYCAMRQREVRELELEQTLFKRSNEYWVVLAPPKHKNDSATGLSREYPLPDFLTSDIDEWLTVWRPKVADMVAQKYPEKSHNPNLVFCALGSNSNPEVLGDPIKDCHLYSMVKYAMFRATSAVFGKGIEIHPHRFRDIAVTHHREHGDPAQKEVLAEMIGHSVTTEDRYYKKLQSRQITKKAKNWWNHYLSPLPKKK